MMKPDMAAKLRRSLILHEKLKHYPYLDTCGKITIGIGYNLTDRGIDDVWIDEQYGKDVIFFYNSLHFDFPWFKDLNSDRQIVLIDMCFNLGFKNFKQFTKMISALERQNYTEAAAEMLDSTWATQVKSRATTLAQALITGVYEV